MHFVQARHQKNVPYKIVKNNKRVIFLASSILFAYYFIVACILWQLMLSLEE